MAKVGVFFSYEFKKNNDLYGSFFAQAKDESRHGIRNYSLDKVHPPADWRVEAEKRIAQCNLVIIVVGQDTHTASGVAEKKKIAKRLVLCHPSIDGYSFLSLIRASSVVKCHFTVARC